MSKRFFVSKKGGAFNCGIWDKSHPALEFAVFDSSVSLGELKGLFTSEKEANRYADILNAFDGFK